MLPLQDLSDRALDLFDIFDVGTYSDFESAELAWEMALIHTSHSPFLAFTTQEALAGFYTLTSIGIDMGDVHGSLNETVQIFSEFLHDLAADWLNFL